MTNRVIKTLLLMIIITINCKGQKVPLSLISIKDSLRFERMLPSQHQIKNRSSFINNPYTHSQRRSNYNNGSNIHSRPVPFGLPTICHDTSERFYLQNDSIYFYVADPLQTTDGNNLLFGQYNSQTSNKFGGSVIKIDNNGNELWHRIFDSAGYKRIDTYYYRALELSDSTIMLVGSTYDESTGNYDLVITKIDAQGNLIWYKVYDSRFWRAFSGDNGLNVQQIKQDPYTGEVYFIGSFVNYDQAFVKMDKQDGSIIWSKLYENNGSYYYYERPFGFDIKQNEIRLFYNFISYKSPYSRAIITTWMTSVEKLNGDTLYSKVIGSDDTSGNKVDILDPEPLKILKNGNYILSGRSDGYYLYPPDSTTNLYQASVEEFDSNFNFIRAYCFKNSIPSNGYNSRVTVYNDGSGYFTMMYYISGFSGDLYSIQFKDGEILKQRKRHFVDEGIPIEPASIRLPDGGDMIIKLVGDSINNKSEIEVLKFHISDTSSSCLGYDDSSTFIYPFKMKNVSYDNFKIIDSVIRESPEQTIVASDITMYKAPACFQVSYCDSLQLIPNSQTVCISNPLAVVARKNIGCGANIFWQYDTTAISSARLVNDSTANFQFNKPWSGYIYGSVPGCSTIQDSIFVYVVDIATTLNLGPDTIICPNNTITLNAHSGFATYKWQDSSTDSIYIVTQPGTYYVQTTDACAGDIFHDTIVVSLHTSSPISIGSDRVKCNNDTIRLVASSGFLSYYWYPNYNINATNSQLIVANPAVDTQYYIKGEQPRGCFSFDSVHVTVYHSPIINLGNDTSLCSGQSILLNAGNGFGSYLWNTGNITDTLTVNDSGTYSIIATDIHNCKSYDSLTVTAIIPLPVVSLNQNPLLCEDSTRVLDAGLFVGYKWQNGSTNRTYTVDGIGTYYVGVVDKNGCKGSDTTKITTIAPLPSNFLPSDTTVCSYETLTIIPLKNYSEYLWSTNETTQDITVTQSGAYWLTVTDENGCEGKDSINIGLKVCQEALYVPSAFAPTSVSGNNKLQPKVYGSLEKFEFDIYNRYGQLIFISKDANIGWDGTLNGTLQDAGTFVWICKYQLAGLPYKVEHGTAVLIK